MDNKAKILIVEDELLIALCLKATLKKHGHEVIKIVCSGDDAVEFALKLKPDIALMDINTKGRINALEAAQIILDKKISVIFITDTNKQNTTGKNLFQTEFKLKPSDELILELNIELVTQN